MQDPLSAARRAFAALSGTGEERYLRGDAACYESELLGWLRNEQREQGPKVWGRQRSQVLRRSHESVGLGSEEAVGLASGESRFDGGLA